MQISIIYQDDDFVVINKPSGISVHGGISVLGVTVIDLLIRQFPEIAEVRDAVSSKESAALRPGVVHRLDKDTSGVMIIARRQSAYDVLKRMFQAREIEKVYYAIVCGIPKEKSGVIALPIGRSIGNPLKRGVARGKIKTRGMREARTEFRVQKSGAMYSLLELKPKTGRMHQLRVHLQALGHPVACDRLYGGKKVCCPLGASRQLLHAASLTFSFPEGVRRYFAADPPEDFAVALRAIA